MSQQDKDTRYRGLILPFLIIFSLIAGAGLLAYRDFEKKKEGNYNIWYVEEITNPYTGVGSVIQVTYKDRLWQERILLFEKTETSMGLGSGEYYLEFSTNDKLLRKTKPWVLDRATKIS
jgi:hypothetical protein